MERILDVMDARINTALPAESLKKPSTSHSSPKHIHPSQKGSRSVYKVAPTVSLTCPICVSPGPSLSKCCTFLSWDQAKKYKAVKEHNHCSSCLSHSHSHRDCTSTHNCCHCRGRHHSLLHRNKRSSHSSNPTSADPPLGGSIDILLGIADVSRCTRGSTSLSENRATVATLTIFGWTLGGAIPQDALPPSILRLQVNEDTLHSALQQLWELEQVPQSDAFSAADHSALQHFDDHYEVLPDGRYSVALPRVDNPPPLGNSRSMALRRFSQNERSLIKKGKLQDFNAVMKEYLTLDHAELVPNEDLLHPPKDVFYLPIHGVFKVSSTTTKLRAVFDASASLSSGTSLNDLLLTGPNLYPPLTTILTKFRFHRIAFSADISKMFREVALQPQDGTFIVFSYAMTRDRSETDYRMKRLTFGVKSSPFLATKVLRHLAKSHKDSHPLASHSILHSFYVDDFLAGASTLQEADAIRQELCRLLKSAGMTLRKWRSNDPSFMTTIPEELRELADLHLPSPLSASKALGNPLECG